MNETDVRTVAFVDESLRQGPQGLCVVCAVFVEHEIVESVRLAMRSALLRRQPTIHWRNESERRRRHILDRVAELDIKVVAFVRWPVNRKQERARALCLKRMLWDASGLAVSRLVIESRGEHNDRKDRQSILHAQKTGVAPTELTYMFRRPVEEPALWVADVFAGAVSAQRAEDETYLDHLPAGLVTVEEVSP